MQTLLNHLVPQYFPTDELRDIAFLGGSYSTLLDTVLPAGPSQHASLTINSNLPSLINGGPAPYIDDFDESFFVVPTSSDGSGTSPLNEIFPSAITKDGLNIKTCAGVMHVVGYQLYPHQNSVPVLGTGGGAGYRGASGHGYGYGEDEGTYGDIMAR